MKINNKKNYKKNNASKKIMLVVPMLHQGGFERVCALTGQLLKAENEVFLVVFNGEDRMYDINGVNYIDLQLGAKEGKLNKAFQLIRRIKALRRLQNKQQVDISYSFGQTANMVNVFSASGVKTIAACHSFAEINISLYMKLMKRADLILCCSKAMAAEVRQSYGYQNVMPLWNPCDIEDIAKKSAKEPAEYKEFFSKDMTASCQNGKFNIVSMGRDDDVKGFWHLLKVFRHVNEYYPESRLAIIGMGEFEECRKLAKDFKIEDKVLFTGVQENPFQYLSKCDLYVLSSISEGLPNALVEAMACGLPIVSVNCKSGPAEILEDDWQEVDTSNDIYMASYGILTPALSPNKKLTAVFENDRIELEFEEKKLAEGILMMLGDEKLRKSYREKGLIRCRAFSAHAYKENMEALMAQHSGKA